MNRPSFLEGTALALVAALLAAVVAGALPAVFGQTWASRALIAGLGLGYVLYLLHRSPRRVGRIATLVGWLAIAVAGWLLLGALVPYLTLHLGMVWLVRSLYHQPGPLAAGLDLGLNLLASMSAVWALLHTGSVFLGVWTFFLVQALFVAIPSVIGEGGSAPPSPDRFGEARRNAEQALRRLSSSH
jgi:hypothetical protein